MKHSKERRKSKMSIQTSEAKLFYLFVRIPTLIFLDSELLLTVRAEDWTVVSLNKEFDLDHAHT